MTQDQLPPVVAADPSRPHTVIERTVPMTHGGTEVVVAGVLTWSPPGWLVWPGHGLLLAGTVAAGWLARGPRPLTGLLAVVAGWLLLVQGLPDVDVLWTANALTAGPQPLARVAVAVLVAGELGLVLGGLGAVRRFRDDAPTGGAQAPGAPAPDAPVGEPALR